MRAFDLFEDIDEESLLERLNRIKKVIWVYKNTILPDSKLSLLFDKEIQVFSKLKDDPDYSYLYITSSSVKSIHDKIVKLLS